MHAGILNGQFVADLAYETHMHTTVYMVISVIDNTHP